MQGHEAAKVAAAEARRRGRRLGMVTDDAADTAAEEIAVRQVAEAAEAWRASNGRAAMRADTVLGRVAGRAARRLQRERPAASAASQAERTKVVRDVAQLLVASGATAERGEVVEAAAVDGGSKGAEQLLGAHLREDARGQLRDMVEAVLQAQSERGEEESHEEEAGQALAEGMGTPTLAQAEPVAEPVATSGRVQAGGDGTHKRARGGSERTRERGGGDATSGGAGAAADGGANSPTERRMGRVDIGKFACGTREPTTAPTEGVWDVAADRKTCLGCAFPIPRRRGEAKQRDERYRCSVVKATELMLTELEERGTTDARRIAVEGPSGDGWLIGGQRVTLPVTRG